jgi:hypothetical protein
MRLDKNHLDQFENIQPPMRAALTLPVVGKKGITVYVCASPFARAERGHTGVHKDVLAVAEALMLGVEPVGDADDLLTLLIKAVDIIMHAPGGHGDVADGLMASVNRLKGAIDEAGDALGGDSNDAEHDALVSLMEALGQTLPEGKD